MRKPRIKKSDCEFYSVLKSYRKPNSTFVDAKTTTSAAQIQPFHMQLADRRWITFDNK